MAANFRRQSFSPARFSEPLAGSGGSLATFKASTALTSPSQGSQGQAIETLASRQADWDRREKAQNQLFEYQWKIIEGQVVQTSALAEGLSTLQHEVVALKEAFLGKFDEHHNMMSDFHQQARSYSEGHHATATERIDYLEKFLGESADRHAKELADANARLANVHGTIAEHQKAISKMASLEHHASVEERLRYVEKMLGDSADKHMKEIEEVKNRYKEVMGHSQAAHSKLQDLHGAFSEKMNNLSLSGQRLDHFEKRLADHQGRHDKHVEEMNKRHQGVQDAFGKMYEQHNNLKLEHKGSLQEHHASVQERLKYLEKVIGDSADKHEKLVAEGQRRLQEAHGKLQEQLQDAHGRIRDAHSKMQDMQGKVQEAHGRLADLHGYVQDAHGKLGDLTGHVHGAAKDLHASMEQRISFLEKFMGDSAEKHLKAEEFLQGQSAKFQEHMQRLNDLHGNCQMESRSRMEAHASVEERLKYLEKRLGDSADEHARQLDDARRAVMDLHGKFSEDIQGIHGTFQAFKGSALTVDHQASIEERMAYIEKLLGDSAEAHARTVEEMQRAHEIHAVSLPERIEYLEQLLNDSAERHKEEIANLHSSLTGLHGQVQTAYDMRDEKHVTLEQRLEFLESKVCDSEGKYSGRLNLATTVVAEQEEVSARVNAITREVQQLESSNLRIEQNPYSIGSSSKVPPSPTFNWSANGLSSAGGGGSSAWKPTAGVSGGSSGYKKPESASSSPWKNVGQASGTAKEAGGWGARLDISSSTITTGPPSTGKLLQKKDLGDLPRSDMWKPSGF